jgi:phosphoenolpyruvate synthase/pyruvate phosphate dikinase
LLELYGENITNSIKQIIAEKRDININNSEALSILTTPLEHSQINKERIDLIKIALDAIKNENESKISLIKQHQQHHKKYSWMGYMFIGPPLNEEHFSKRLDEYLKSRDNIIEDLKKLISKDRLKEKQEQLIRDLNFNDKEKQQIQVAKEILYMKVLRKDSMVNGWYSADSLISEIAKRLNISKRLVGFFMDYEINDVLLKSNIPDLKQRFDLSLIDFQDGNEKIILGNNSLLLEKERVTEKSIVSVNEIKGTCAYKGNVRGIVKIVNSREDINKVAKGDILVSYATNPDLVLAMEKAAAFVTDRGGLTCHAAIVAREMEKPCLIGTEIATKVLKDGDLVEVDASNELLRVIQRKQQPF